MRNRYGLLALLLSALALSACDSVGEGNGLLRLEIRIPGAEGTLGEADYLGVAYECLGRSTELLGYFTNGSSGSFRSRATWTSSDESVLRVSNGEIPVDDGSGNNYARGLLLPVAPGRATITAEYVGLRNSVEVEVRTPDEIRLNRTVAAMAPLTQEAFQLLLVLDGVEQTATTDTVWSLNEEATDFGFVNVGGIVFANEPGTTVTLTGSLPLCADNAALGNGARSTDIRFETPTDISIEAEYAPDTAGGPAPMMRNTTQQFTATAQFGDGATQLLSNQPSLIWTSSNQDVAIFGAGLRGLLTGVYSSSEGTESALTEISAALDVVTNGVSSEFRSESTSSAQVEVFDLPLTDFSVSPATATIEPVTSQQFTATGNFADGQRTQVITRDVTWTSDTPTALVISNQLSSRGRASSIRFETEPLQVEITAIAAISGENQTRTAALTVNAVDCSDGVDNDEDGFIDFNEDETLSDPGCSSQFDTDESDA